MTAILAISAAAAALVTSQETPDLTLRGSPAAMQEQNRVAQEHGLQFFETREEVEAALQTGDLVPLNGNGVYDVADFVVPPYIHPDVLPFVERTADLYLEACGEPLVVTSAVRPRQDQPPNAHELSVHPAGIAVDFRVSQTQECREWFEEKLLALEEVDAINATRERSPPHYHVAVYPRPYLMYAQANPLQRLPPPQTTDETVASSRTVSALVAWLAAAALLLGASYFALTQRATRDPDEP
ncbi:MAG TPA: DUF5715 family protein [Longimicrobiales bacterium]|nr:DUF5715 family protein [Longimicrobiales bacterium]